MATFILFFCPLWAPPFSVAHLPPLPPYCSSAIQKLHGEGGHLDSIQGRYRNLRHLKRKL